MPRSSATSKDASVHEAFDTVVAYVVEASFRGGRPLLHAVMAGVHCNLAINPLTIEAQVQSGMVMGLGTTLPGAQITLKDGVVQESNWHDYRLATVRAATAFANAGAMGGSAHSPIPVGTPGHTGYEFTSKGQTLLVWGDVVHVPAVQLPRPDIGIDYDIDGPSAVKAREQLFAELAARQTLIATHEGMNMPSPVVLITGALAVRPAFDACRGTAWTACAPW